METTIEMMIREKIAVNQWQASHIAEGLELWKCETREEQVKRCRLYRDWRNAGEDSKTAYRRAKNGDPVPTPLFGDVLHSDECEHKWDRDENGEWCTKCYIRREMTYP